jgi:hypothetical protein
MNTPAAAIIAVSSLVIGGSFVIDKRLEGAAQVGASPAGAVEIADLRRGTRPELTIAERSVDAGASSSERRGNRAEIDFGGFDPGISLEIPRRGSRDSEQG